MIDVPDNLRFTPDHEWLRLEDDGTVTVGITDHAQQALGELVYVELPEVGRECEAGDACAVVESVKAASDVYAPVAGEITEVNEDLEDSPESVNSSPYEDGWLMRIQPVNPAALEDLFDADAYRQFVAESEG